MNVIFFNDKTSNFLPLVYTQPLVKLRFGILTLEEKWRILFSKYNLSVNFSYLDKTYLENKFPIHIENDNYFINSRFLPNPQLIQLIKQLTNGKALLYQNELIAARCSQENFFNKTFQNNKIKKDDSIVQLNSITDFFSKNEWAIQNDFNLITENKTSAKISSTNRLIGSEIFIEDGAKVEASVLNSSFGPIFIGKDAEIMEGCLIRGPFALCEGATLKMGAKIYGATTIGKYSKVGGEVNNSVIQDYSNKGHDGFLGNSVIGSWCNLGADTNTSNLKNNYGNVKLWNYKTANFENFNLQFCGLIMGDHSKCGINTMFNTGTTVGVSANIFDGGFPPKFIPSFSWGSAKGFVEYKVDKMLEVAHHVMKRRCVELTIKDKELLIAIFNSTKHFRE